MDGNRKQDPYDELGVGRDADETEIRRAYRKIAKEHHPDLSGRIDDPERFRSATDAYDLLCDPERRAGYDRRGKPRSSWSPPTTARPTPADDIQARTYPGARAATETIEFAAILTESEAETGGEFDVAVPIPVRCPSCGGSPFASWFCRMCEGSGELETEVVVRITVPRRVHHGSVTRIPVPGVASAMLEMTFIISDR
jgi:molecular chaperone DnaJ